MTHTVGPCLQITKLFLDYFMVFPHGRQIVYACGVTLGKMRRMHGSLQRREVCLNGSIEWLLCPRKFTIILQATTPTKCPHVVFIPWANSLVTTHLGTLLHKISCAWTMVERKNIQWTLGCVLRSIKESTIGLEQKVSCYLSVCHTDSHFHHFDPPCTNSLMFVCNIWGTWNTVNPNLYNIHTHRTNLMVNMGYTTTYHNGM